MEFNFNLTLDLDNFCMGLGWPGLIDGLQLFSPLCARVFHPLYPLLPFLAATDSSSDEPIVDRWEFMVRWLLKVHQEIDEMMMEAEVGL